MPNVFHAMLSSNRLSESLKRITRFSQTRLNSEQAFRGLLFSKPKRSDRSGHSFNILLISTDKKDSHLHRQTVIDRGNRSRRRRYRGYGLVPLSSGDGLYRLVSRGTHGRRGLNSSGARFCGGGVRPYSATFDEHIASGVTRQGEQSPPDQSLPTSRVGRDRVVSGSYEAPRSKLRGMLKFTVSISVRHLASLQYSQCRGTKTLCFCSKWSHSLVGKR